MGQGLGFRLARSRRVQLQFSRRLVVAMCRNVPRT